MSTSAASLEESIPAEAAPEEARAAAAFVETHYAFVWRVLRRFGLSPADADDAAQHVFLGAVPRLRDIEPGKERSFLFRTAMHTASKAHRSRRRRREDADGETDDRPHDGPSPDVLVEQRRARALLDLVLEEMPVELKAVIVLFEIEGFTMSEIADTLSVPLGTVASRLRRARAELEIQVARHRGERGGRTRP